MKIVIPMAGTGERFRAAGYASEKGDIEVLGHSLLEWSVVSLRGFFEHDFIFVARRGVYAAERITESAVRAGLDRTRVHVVLLDAPTRGQADTVLAASTHIRGEDDLLVYNIDTYVYPRALGPRDVRGDGWIPVFPAEGDRWSFVEADANGRASRVTEKRRISNHCSVGIYYFKSFRLFRELVETRRDDGREWFIAPLYQQMIDRGQPVYLHQLSDQDVYVFGTPEDLREAEPRLRADDRARDVWKAA